MLKRFLTCTLIVAFVLAISVFFNAFASESTGVKGDLNYDGVLNRKDYKLLNRYVSDGTATNIDLTKVDFNGNGTVDKSDLTAMNTAIVKNFDNNGDGYLTVADFHLLEKYLTNYDVNTLGKFDVNKCDYNGDGKVTFVDLNQLGYYELFEIYTPPYWYYIKKCFWKDNLSWKNLLR